MNRLHMLIMILVMIILSGCAIGNLETGIADNTNRYYPVLDENWSEIDPGQLGWDIDALEEVFEFAQKHHSSGLVILFNGRIVARRQWSLDNPEVFAGVGYQDVWFHGTSPDGWAKEDVASTQKSIIAVLAGIAQDRGLLKLDDPVSQYLGVGWSQASAEQEAAVSIRHLLSMSSGLSEKLDYVFDAGSDWAYINKAYSLVNEVIQAASGLAPNVFTREWLTEPMGMTQTEWITRSEFFRQWNMNGLVTTAPDLARFGLMIQAGGEWANRRIVSKTYLDQALSASTPHNPSYGYLWWVNSPEGFRGVRGSPDIVPGRRIPDAPADWVSAAGTSDRRSSIVPSLGLVVARTGSPWKLKDDGTPLAVFEFDQQLWKLLAAALPENLDKRVGRNSRR